MTGRGTNDAKGSVAAQIMAVNDLIESKLIGAGDVSLLYVVGEEVDGAGMIAANDQLKGLEWESVIFGEPTELKLAVGHKGLVVFYVHVDGIPAHSGYPHLGISANEIMVNYLHDLMNIKWPSSELIGNTTFNVGIIEGGKAINIIPESSSASLSIRVAAGFEDILELLDEYQQKYPGLQMRIETAYPPIEMQIMDGFELFAASYGTDVPHLKGNHKKYLYGPGSILSAHGEHECMCYH